MREPRLTPWQFAIVREAARIAAAPDEVSAGGERLIKDAYRIVNGLAGDPGSAEARELFEVALDSLGIDRGEVQ